MAQKNNYKECIKILENLHREHPSYSLGRHLSSALEDYSDIWSVSDKELLYALTKYKAELEIDGASAYDDYVEKIVKDAQNLDTILEEEEDYD